MHQFTHANSPGICHHHANLTRPNALTLMHAPARSCRWMPSRSACPRFMWSVQVRAGCAPCPVRDLLGQSWCQPAMPYRHVPALRVAPCHAMPRHVSRARFILSFQPPPFTLSLCRHYPRGGGEPGDAGVVHTHALPLVSYLLRFMAAVLQTHADTTPEEVESRAMLEEAMALASGEDVPIRIPTREVGLVNDLFTTQVSHEHKSGQPALPFCPLPAAHATSQPSMPESRAPPHKLTLAGPCPRPRAPRTHPCRPRHRGRGSLPPGV